MITNFHVIEKASSIEVGLRDKRTFRAELVAAAPAADIAILRITGRDLPALPFGDSDRLAVGDLVVAIGNPFGLDRTATAGIVSALQRNVTAPNGSNIDHVIQTDAPINQGNSGGPLLNARGEVVGVNSQISSPNGGGNVGIGFSVPANTVKSVAGQLIRLGKVDRSDLGLYARALEPDVASLFRLPVDTGLLVERVEQGSPARRAGVRGGSTSVVVSGTDYTLGGDILVAADGKRVTSLAELRDLLALHRPGDRVELELYRGSDKRTVTVTLGRQSTTPRG